MPNPTLAETFLEIKNNLANKHGLANVQFQYADDESELSVKPRIHLIPTKDSFEPGMVTQTAQEDTIPGKDGANIEVKFRAPWQCLEGGDFHFFWPKSADRFKDSVGLRRIIGGLILCIHHIHRARENYRLGDGYIDRPQATQVQTLHYVLPVKIRYSIVDYQPTARPNTVTVLLGSVPKP